VGTVRGPPPIVGFTATTEAKSGQSAVGSGQQTQRVTWDREEQRPTRQTIVIDTPPRTHTTIENHYVPVESDRYQNAHAWAREQVARKQPGATATIHQLESLIRQKLASEAS
jgi:hypothetical protein